MILACIFSILVVIPFLVKIIHEKDPSQNSLLHVLEITKNLLGVSKFARDNGVFFEFHPTFSVKDLQTKQILLEGKSKCGLYAFNLDLSNGIIYQGSSSSSPVTEKK